MNLLCLSAILLTIFTRISFGTRKINTFIPKYCTPLQYNQKISFEDLSGYGNTSALVVIGYLYEGLIFNNTDNECYVIVRAPKNFGIVATVKKASIHENDTLVFQRSSISDVSFKGDEEHKNKEIVSFPQSDDSSSIRMKYIPSVKRSEHMAGFEIAFTSYYAKGESCGDDFDCGNERCISPDFQCDGYNNCGNDKDEEGCAGVSLWIIILLILLGILVVVLAIFVWYRMAQR